MIVDLGQAKIGISLAVQIFDEFFKELMASGILPNTFSFDREALQVNFTVRLNPPDLALVDAVPLRTELRLKGNIEVRPAGQTNGPPSATFPLDVKVLLSFVLVSRPGQVPVLGLSYEGVADAPSPPLSESDVDDFFQMPEIASVLGSVLIDVVGPAVEALEGIFFPDGIAPARDAWSIALRLLPATTSSEMHAVGLFVALPGDIAEPITNESFLPARTGFGLVYSRNFLDFTFHQGAQQQEGEKVEGATIKELSMQMDDTAIQVDGKAETSLATITFIGPVIPHLVPGTVLMFQDTDGINVDVDVPWWADVLLFFRFIPVFWPILIPATVISPKLNVWRASSEIRDAPVQIREGLAGILGHELVNLAKGLTVQKDLGSVELDATPDSSRIENGHIMLFAQTFVAVLTETMIDAFYSKKLGRFAQYVLASGRLFRASELARLVRDGKIVTPGFHQVKGQFMRANADNELGNNLKTLFGQNLAQEPY